MNSSLVKQLKSLVQEKHLLQHPFYRMWDTGKLPRAVLSKYAEQYYHLENNFPRFLSQLHVNCADPAIRQIITDNLYDEEHGVDNHRELWLRFGETVGATRQDMIGAILLPETQTTLMILRELCSFSLIGGIAALAVYETELADVAETKIMGLTTYYGITDESGLVFFRAHGIQDQHHSEAWWQIITEASTPALEAEVHHAVIEARDTLWNFLDGICRVYVPGVLTTTVCN